MASLGDAGGGCDARAEQGCHPAREPRLFQVPQRAQAEEPPLPRHAARGGRREQHPPRPGAQGDHPPPQDPQHALHQPPSKGRRHGPLPHGAHVPTSLSPLILPIYFIWKDNFMCDMLEKYGNDAVFVDSTHKVTKYGYLLYSLHVRDSTLKVGFYPVVLYVQAFISYFRGSLVDSSSQTGPSPPSPASSSTTRSRRSSESGTQRSRSKLH